MGHFAWYDRKATVARWGYIVLRLVAITAAAVVTVLAAWGAPGPLTASFGAVIVVAEGAQQLFQFHANWINYRRCAEEMRQQAIPTWRGRNRMTGPTGATCSQPRCTASSPPRA